MKYFLILYGFLGFCLSNKLPILCRNCQHFIPLRFKNDFIISPNYGKCNKFITIINKELDYEYVEKARRVETMCGSEGKYFSLTSNNTDSISCD